MNCILDVEAFEASDTQNIAFMMARDVQPGQVIALGGDLGAGKTTFAQGFALGLGIAESICSPTFNIVRSYEGGRLPLHHFDVYRISDPDEMYETGYEEYFFGEGVCLVEWAELIEELLPEETVYISITRDMSKGSDYRHIVITQND